MTFASRYGPWAIIAGASQGIGRAIAHRVAGEGVSCLVVARNADALATLASEIRDRHGVECEALSADLSAPDAADRIAAAAGDREVGLYVNNAGADSNGSRFLDRDIVAWEALVAVNIVSPMRAVHRFGAPMKQRGRGGILLIGSGACYTGTSFTSVYSGSKAFELTFADGLWAELKPYGVDVLFCALGATDTPAFRTLLESRGMPMFPGVADPEDVAEQVLARLDRGPLFNWGEDDDSAGNTPMSAAARRARVLVLEEATKRVFGNE